jgi:hypothetical protein
MTQPLQVTFDAGDPAAQSRFWALALGYLPEPPPPGFDTWEAFARSIDLPEERWNDFGAAVHPDRAGPRLFFQNVPEGKPGESRTAPTPPVDH